MTKATQRRVHIFRPSLATGESTSLGYAVYTHDGFGGKGWVFFPEVFGRNPSRKLYPTWEECLPEWVGYPAYCMSEFVKIAPK